MNETRKATKPYQVHVLAGNWFADFVVEARNERHSQIPALGSAAIECPNNLRHWLRAVC